MTRIDDFYQAKIINQLIRRRENDWFIFYAREKDPDVMWNLSYDTSEDICKLKPELMSSLPDLPPPLCRTPAIQITSCSQAHNTSRRHGYCVSICEHKLPRSIFSIVTAMSPALAWRGKSYMIVHAKTLNLTLMTVRCAYHFWWQSPFTSLESILLLLLPTVLAVPASFWVHSGSRLKTKALNSDIAAFAMSWIYDNFRLVTLCFRYRIVWIFSLFLSLVQGLFVRRWGYAVDRRLKTNLFFSRRAAQPCSASMLWK